MAESPHEVRSYQWYGRRRCGGGPPWAYRPAWAPPASDDPVAGLAAGPNLRASDAERAAVTDTLTRHHLAGRLDVDEYTERIEVAYAAKTRGELTPLLADLPAEPPPTRPRRARPRGLWVIPLLALASLLALTVVTGHPVILGGWWIPLVAWFWWRNRPAAPVRTHSR
jgi:hypothetical protein